MKYPPLLPLERGREGGTEREGGGREGGRVEGGGGRREGGREGGRVIISYSDHMI